MQPTITIETVLAQKIIAYLAGKPYAEVHHLISGLLSAEAMQAAKANVVPPGPMATPKLVRNTDDGALKVSEAEEAMST